MARARVPDETQAALFAASRRRCCICVALDEDTSEKAGQIAHLNHDPSNPRFDNLVWLCLEHHNKYDSRTSQSKGLTVQEVRLYRDNLYRRLSSAGLVASEVDFLRSYFLVIRPDLDPSHRYVDIVSTHLETLRREIRRLRETACWEILLEVRTRLRECFEYSGRYKDAWQFGTEYAQALGALGRHHERRWVLVKDVGYMLILDGEHERGRKTIRSVLSDADTSASNVDDRSAAELRFYAHRYLGISFQRAPKRKLTAAKRAFDTAGKVVREYRRRSGDGRALPELHARLLGNYGNLALDTGEAARALELMKESLALFRRLHDPEHVGIACLGVAKALIRQGGARKGDPIQYLVQARTIFSQLSWLEGQGRVHEQLARHYLAMASAGDTSASVRRRAGRAMCEAERAQELFRRMPSDRWVGRIEGLIEEIMPWLPTGAAVKP